MSDASVRDPYLDLPLDGVRLVEASAGTGKTFTLATLVTRLMVERGLRIGQILAVTFTKAATQELRTRIRQRLLLALELVDAPASDEESAEAMLTRDVLRAHLERSGENEGALRRRLLQATMEVDLAAIFTIDGFCARVLREHALDSSQGFDQMELLTGERSLRKDLAADLWRTHGRDAAGADDLAALWKDGPRALADDLRALLREPVLLPPTRADDDGLLEEAHAQLGSARADLCDAWENHGESFVHALCQAIDADVMNRNSYKLEWVANLRQWLQDFSGNPRQAVDVHPKLEKLTAEALTKGTKKDHKAKTPMSPSVSNAVSFYLDAARALEERLARRRVALLHRLRDDARARLVTLKRQRRVQTYDDLIDGVADALDGPHGDALARSLRAQYAVALVDEFQDTDARQWKIFDRVFGSGSPDPGLFLIGDPKQAIYGFRGGDVHVYLDASKLAVNAPALSQNFRSRPSVLKAIAALYQSAQDAFDALEIKAPPFVDSRINFHQLEAGDKRVDADFMRDGAPAPALTLWRAPPPTEMDAKGNPKPWSASRSRELATDACVAAIHALLSDARGGKATIKHGEAMHPVQPGDIAVLVRTHFEATRIQQALAAAGIPAVAAGKQSLFATGEARELHALLLALLQDGGDGRLRAVLSTVLVGKDAAAIDALEQDGDAHRDWQRKALAWRERLLRGGPLALVSDLCATHAERLLGLVDGERRVSNYLQLAEALQEAQARALGLHGLVDWLGRRIVQADPDDETQLLRLESDARRVQIVTLHKSKGLEYPLVFLPFAGIGAKEKSPGNGCVAHDDTHGRRLHWKFELPEAERVDAEKHWKKEQRAEDARLLYVGLTRAEHALWIATGNFYNFEEDKCALWPMLRAPGTLAAVPGIRFDDSESAADLPRPPPESDAAIPPARVAMRMLSRDWWVYSFTQLSNADAGDIDAAVTILDERGAADESESLQPAQADAVDRRFSGSRFGNVLHAALEHVDFSAWRDWRGGDAPAGQGAALDAALRAEGYGDADLDDGRAALAMLVGNTLTVPLPEGGRLCDLPIHARRAELEFHFALQPTSVDALLATLHAHGVLRGRHAFGARRRLEGLMTGKIDLTYTVGNRWYLLDYKSNRLPDYDDASLAQAMVHSEYDLQALIYTVAVHRWLRFRLGDVYDYARDFGGARYLFCRGLDAGATDGRGIHAWTPPVELVTALDALFAGGHA